MDLERLASQILAPSRPRLADALAAVTSLEPDEALRLWNRTLEVRGRQIRIADPWARRARGVRDPGEAWEALAARGIIPDAWVASERRRVWEACERHAHGGKGSEPCAACGGDEGGFGRAGTPRTVRGCVALASDASGVAAAEALAREVAARIGLAPSRVVWRIEWNWQGRVETAPPSGFRLDAPDRFVRFWNEPWTAYICDAARRAAFPAPAEALFGLRRCVESRRGAPQIHAAARCASGDLLCELLGPDDASNPFGPSREIWSLGYALERITDDEVVLVAPDLVEWTTRQWS